MVLNVRKYNDVKRMLSTVPSVVHVCPHSCSHSFALLEFIKMLPSNWLLILSKTDFYLHLVSVKCQVFLCTFYEFTLIITLY